MKPRLSGTAYPLERLFGRVLSPFERFLQRTTAGGIVLMVTTVIALLVASNVGQEAIHAIRDGELALVAERAGELRYSLHHWVNDGLMALFFLLVGLELKREMLVGELASLRDAALPIFAALGGMLVPAGVYLGFNAGTPAANGWGIPMATDIAFAVGIMVLLAWRIPRNLIVFLTALAIADDLGAVLVIALFYSTELDMGALWSAVSLTLVLALMNRGGVRRPLPYAVVGLLLWHALHVSGLHATLAGIVLAFAIPARPSYSPREFDWRLAELQTEFHANRRNAPENDNPLSNARMAEIAESVEGAAVAVQSPLQRMEHALTPLVTFLVIPIFALVNAGIDLTVIDWGETLQNGITLGVLVGLVLGKFTGVTLFAWVAVRLGLARLPSGVRWIDVAGSAWLAGIGFTMSLFIAQLAFALPEQVEEAKIGILLGSAISAGIGLVWLYLAGSRRAREPS